MSRTRNSWAFVLPLYVFCFLLCAARAASVEAGEDRLAADDLQPAVPLQIGGTGGVYFLAPPGELVVEIQKCDRNRSTRTTELRAILVGPDRRVLEEVTIPDAGEARGSGLGKPLAARLQTEVERKGVYGLNVTVSQDRYGDEIAWGFRTNCPHFLIETSRGHRDERRSEPIVLLSPQREGDVCFRPRAGAFEIEITGLPPEVESVSLFDGRDRLWGEIPVDAEGRASGRLSAEPSRDPAPWRLRLPSQQVVIQIDGVTRWESGDPFPGLPYWTPVASSWFPLQEFRWLLTPYQRNVHGEAGGEREIAFQVHNNGGDRIEVDLTLEFPDEPWPARLASERVAVAAGRTAAAVVHCRVPAEGEARTCHLRATPRSSPGFSTYATLTVTSAAAPADAPLATPITLLPYRHENEQFGYLPDYPVESQVYFDLENRPYVAAGSTLATKRDGRWTEIDLREAVDPPAGSARFRSLAVLSGKVAFDEDNNVYLLARADGRAVVLHSRDGGQSFSAWPIPGAGRSGAFDLEQFSGHNVPPGPPPILRYTLTTADPKLKWRRINDLELIVAEKGERGLSFAEPVLVSRKCIGLAAHSGIPSSVVSRAGKVHVAWAEATEPDEQVPGVPTFVVTYDTRSRSLGEPALVGYGAPPNDIHNSPSITMDSRGYLHVLAGTHGRPFQYARSLVPNDAGGGWTEAVALGEDLRQTYIGLVCDREDTLHAVFRMWRYGEEPFPASHHGTLAWQEKRAGRSWGDAKVLIVPPFSEYSVYYHRLTIDRAGRLFLSYDYWSTYWFYRTDHRGDRRALLTSPDGGQTWKLAGPRDFD